MQQSKEGNAAQVLQGYGCAYFVIWYWDLDSDKKKTTIYNSGWPILNRWRSAQGLIEFEMMLSGKNWKLLSYLNTSTVTVRDGGVTSFSWMGRGCRRVLVNISQNVWVPYLQITKYSYIRKLAILFQLLAKRNLGSSTKMLMLMFHMKG